MSISKLLIANRGEIAVRIIRAAHELGLQTVQVYSEADASSLAVKMAHESVLIGPPVASKSYLDASAILKAAHESGADAIHPGYGFLAENADFADAVESSGLTFVGPTGDTIRRMGDKITARKVAEDAGVPTVPGSNGLIQDLEEAKGLATRIGYPVMIKATAGGGGRGIRIAENENDLLTMTPAASTEAKAAFGNGGLYLEKVIPKARHIEVQILGDGINVIHCYERECSLQRKRQKIWEEAPSSALPPDVREALCASAVRLASSVSYRGAGTIEYLYDEPGGKFYFIEMNTRIQVEHPTTELITGIDLVAEMIRIASGEPMSLTQSNIDIRGHAIEVRINAEDPANKFMPYPGLVDELHLPGGPGIRFDHYLYRGYQVPPFYDSLLGKLIVHARSREDAIMRLKRALGELNLGSMKTTAPLFAALVAEPDVINGMIHTKWLESWLESHSEKLMQHEGKSA